MNPSVKQTSYGYVRVVAAVPVLKIANPDYNAGQMIRMLEQLQTESPDLVVFPELSLSGYSCGELFMQKTLQDATIDALSDILSYSKTFDSIIVTGAPLLIEQGLYNCAVIIFKGHILGVVPKIYLPNKNEFYDKRWFVSGRDSKKSRITLLDQDVPFGHLIFKATSKEFSFGAEICEDLWAPVPPSSFLYLKRADLIVNLSASNALVAKSDYRKALVSQQSARFNGGYLYCSAGVHESTTDYVMDGHAMISENGTIINESTRFERNNSWIISDIDIDVIRAQRLRNTSYFDCQQTFNLETINEVVFDYPIKKKTDLKRIIDPAPFVPANPDSIHQRCAEIFQIQTTGLAKRLEHTGITTAVIGISGGLDSTLAFLVTVKTFAMLGIPASNIIAVTMPGFGTTDQTYDNAVALVNKFGATLKDIDIQQACLLHFEMIGHDPKDLDVTYENVQARERTAVLMNLANKHGGLVIGTGDLSELALGWCTYNGDHMSMYSVNNSIPKTLVRHLVAWYAQRQNTELNELLCSIITTPISPELLPKGKDGQIEQKTEEIIGPYEVHDFFLYHFIKHGFSKNKLLFLSQIAFIERYSLADLEKWLDIFYRRFFSQQFKRSCLPDGPKVGSVSLSPRADWKMPSDADPYIWQRQ